jgi:hypothetical protein
LCPRDHRWRRRHIGGHFDKENGKLILIDATGVRATTDTITGVAMKWLVVGF